MTGTAFGPQGPNYATSRPALAADASGGADTWFVDCSTQGATNGTFVTSDFLNVLVDQLRTLVRTSGTTLDKTNSSMVFNAVQTIAYPAAVSLSVATTITAAQVGTFVELTGASTFVTTFPTPVGAALLRYVGVNNSSAVQTLTTPAGAWLGPQGSSATTVSIPVGSYYAMWSDGLNWQLILHAAGTASGRLLNIQIFTASQTYTPTAGTNSIIVEVQGAGASGGSVTGPNNVSYTAYSGGGSGGTFGKGMFTSRFSGGVSVIVGAGGAPSASGNNAGNAGGASSFGSLISAPGGIAGIAGATVAPPNVGGGGNVPASATGANILSSIGAPGTVCLAVTYNIGAPSRGGGSPLGEGGQTAYGTPGISGFGPGAGGSGCIAPGNYTAGLQGGAGVNGLVTVYEFS